MNALINWLSLAILCAGCNGRQTSDASDVGDTAVETATVDAAADAYECPLGAVGVVPDKPCSRPGLRCAYACGTTSHTDKRFVAVCTATGWTWQDIELCGY